MNGKKIVAYHGNCSDGMTAAFVAKLWHEENGFSLPEFVPVNPRVAPDIDPTGASIVMFDTCLNREDLLDWKKKAVSFEVWDHHISNAKEFGDLSFCHFDMTKSGAGLAWEFYHGNTEKEKNPPWWVSFTQDRDLWEWKLPESKEVNAFLMSLDLNFEEYGILKFASLTGASEIGRNLLKSDRTKINRALKTAFPILFEGHQAYCVNSPNFQSELANEVCQLFGVNLGICWFFTPDDNNQELVAQVSLRSIGDLDVSEIAKRFGGGGHKNAAGFRVPMATWIFRLLNKK